MIRASLLALALLMAARLEAHAQTGVDLVSRSELRVCSDPSDLPFSDQHGDGFENRIVELLGQDLHLPVRYTWYPNSVGFLRNTLLALKCDIVAGTVSGAPMMLTTSPYYRTGYMIVTRSADHIAVRSLADPLLRGKRIGLVAGTPPGDLVVRHGLMAQVRPYELNVDTATDEDSLEQRDLALRAYRGQSQMMGAVCRVPTELGARLGAYARVLHAAL